MALSLRKKYVLNRSENVDIIAIILGLTMVVVGVVLNGAKMAKWNKPEDDYKYRCAFCRVPISDKHVCEEYYRRRDYRANCKACLGTGIYGGLPCYWCGDY